MSRDAYGALTVSGTKYLILTELSSDNLSLTNAELNSVKDLVKNTGNEGFLSQDPTDFEATATRSFNKYGTWTQGAYIAGLGETGFFAKIYGVGHGVFGQQGQAQYIRPIAAPYDITITGITAPVGGHVWSPEMQRLVNDSGIPLASIDAMRVASAEEVATLIEEGVSATHSFIYPASFKFRNLYKIKSFSENTAGKSGGGRTISVCNTERSVSLHISEVYTNTLACWMAYKIDQGAQTTVGAQPNI